MLKYDSFRLAIIYVIVSQTPKLLLRKITFFFTIYKKMSSQTIEMKFNELSNNMSIKLINGLRLYISLIKKNIDNGKKS